MSDENVPRFDFPGTFDLSGERAVVTAGSCGIGRAIAHGLVAAGVDVADEDDVEDCFEAVAAELGRRSVVANDAGVNPAMALGTPDRENAEEFDQVNDVNLRGAQTCAHAAAPHLAATDDSLVNCLAPGYVATDLTGDLTVDEELAASIRERTPLDRFAELGEVAGPEVFLASPAVSHLTGTTIGVDGGWTAR